ncbi:hypothetical protein DdX_17498 [Ditylenchus destructor]|uniref:Uncharacterized protein n=1 Tax=Ditylenchus destructor TaxID=166010 RepID=A0AAD4MNZ9_9BILA|nr:hypothetical protein DdX_17498 [Ditylenchus destructor]
MRIFVRNTVVAGIVFPAVSGLVQTYYDRYKDQIETIVKLDSTKVLTIAFGIGAFAVFAMDKGIAQVPFLVLWRTPNIVLHILSLVGGFGAIAAIFLLRHKISQVAFLTTSAAMIAAHYLIPNLPSMVWSVIFGVEHDQRSFGNIHQ